VDSQIQFGKYKGKTYREVFEIAPGYIGWFLRNNQKIDIDVDSFIAMINTRDNMIRNG